MSPQWHETLAQVWPVWQRTNQAGCLENVPGYQSPWIAGLTACRGRHLEPFIDSQWQSCSAYCIFANQLSLHGGSHIKAGSQRRRGEEVWRREPRGRPGPTCNSVSWASWCLQPCRQQGPSLPPPCLPPPWSGVEASLFTTQAWYVLLRAMDPCLHWLSDMCILLFNLFFFFFLLFSFKVFVGVLLFYNVVVFCCV